MRTVGPFEKKVIWGFRALFVVGFIVAVYSFVVEPSRLVVHRHEVALGPGWPEPLDGLRVAVLSDLHVGSPWNGLERLPRIVETVRRENPDLMVLLGDFQISDVMGGSYVPPSATAELLGKIELPYGAFAVLGNHDWWEGGPRTIAALTANGITVLEDTTAPVQVNGTSFWIVGLSDDTTRTPNYEVATSGVPIDAPKLVITHDPAAFMALRPRHGASLFLAGHMHGGQVYLPWLFPPITPGRAPKKWAYGFENVRGTPLFVTGGIGTSIYPVRLNQPPEIVILTLRSGGTPGKRGANNG